jgi:phage tail sheath protein FI
MSQINESAIKTPGVYVNEIPSFPPSIAQVATAIPAFIGYTEFAKTLQGTSLTNDPTRITSLLEYELYFGKAQPETNIEITYDQTTIGKATETISIAFTNKSRHNMHSAIRLFYANGGGAAYIISVGPYKLSASDEVGEALVKTDFDAGLAALRKEDEPTLIVFPEGQNMDKSEYYALQNNALAQCAFLQDRFCIIDLYDTGEGMLTSSDLDTALGDFRNSVAADNKNYGAAYFPNLKTVYSYSYDESKTIIHHNVDGVAGSGALDGKTLSEISTLSPSSPPASPPAPPPFYNLAAYNAFKQALNTKFPMVLPPSPAIAGVYSTVDASRGVWKAPANVGFQDVSAYNIPDIRRATG